MIPGATLLNYNKRYGLKEFFKKRAVKTLIPFLAWSLIALIIQLAQGIFNGEKLPSFLSIFKKILSGEIVDFYWFFPVLFCVYFCVPLFAAVEENKRKVVFSYLAIACFVLNIVIPFVIQVLHLSYSFPYAISVGSGYLFYLIVGYLLNEYNLTRSFRFTIYFLAFLGLIVHILGTYYLSIEANEIVRTFKGYNNLPCVLYSIGVFVFFKTILQKKQPSEKSILDRTVMIIKKYTLSIYLIHWFILRIALKFLQINNRSLTFRLLSPIPIILICIGITFLLRKIPVIKRIVPE